MTTIAQHCTAKSRRRGWCREHTRRRFIGPENPRCGSLVSPAHTGCYAGGNTWKGGTLLRGGVPPLFCLRREQ